MTGSAFRILTGFSSDPYLRLGDSASCKKAAFFSSRSGFRYNGNSLDFLSKNRYVPL